MEEKKESRKRTLSDRVISRFDSIRYAIEEPLKLRIARKKYGHLYGDQKDKPFVSVHICTFNRGQLLVERAVPSVMGQTYKNLELIIDTPRNKSGGWQRNCVS